MAWTGSDDSDFAMELIKLNIFRRDLNAPYMATKKQTIETLFWRRYWNRLWIVQEIMLARSIIVQCGEKEFQIADF